MIMEIVKNLLAVPFIPLIGAFGAVTIYTTRKVNKQKKIRLQKLNPYEQQGYMISNGTQIANKYNTIIPNNTLDYRGREIVRPYMEQLVNSLGNDIRLARKNFSTLRIEQDKTIRKTGAAGNYCGTENIIKYVTNKGNVLGHEMLHMASFMYDEYTGTYHYGFMQQRGEAKIGMGLNEGYTELLAARMFNNGKVTSYPRLVRIVKLLEEFFPNPQAMSHCYFTCNLPAFIQNIERYCTREEMKDILLRLDELYEYEFVAPSPVAVVKETQLATRLYRIYERNFATEPAKVQAFKTKAGENKLTALAISGRRTSTQRNNPFRRIKDGLQNGFRRIKNFFTGNQQQPQPAYSR